MKPLATIRLHNLFIINKAGGLIYSRKQAFTNCAKLEGNDFLSMASTFHSLHAIASQVAPSRDPYLGGIESVEVDTFRLCCFQALTGIKIFVTADQGDLDLEKFLQDVYEIYSDYVLKNPFYTFDQAIRCTLFDKNLLTLASKYAAAGQITKAV